MKIYILGPAHPYRGGLASIMEIMARVFASKGADVKIKTFTLQYPSILFPGKSQFTDKPAPEGLDIERCVNTANPLNWIALGRRIKRERPDMVILKYWTPFMAPCFGTIARIARSNGHTKFLCQIDNVEPHEHHFIDRPFNRYFLNSMDGFVYMSEQVNNELKAYTQAPSLFSPHPLFENFGERVSRSEGCAHFELDTETEYALFFGLIRDYKGLDILIDAWSKLKQNGKTNDRKLIVAGEFYTSKDSYLKQLKDNDCEDDIILMDHFIKDEDVRYLFSAVDFVVQPYKTATQSGVTQIAYQFCTPMIVTNVGGLAEIVPDSKVGYVCEPNANDVARVVDKIWNKETLETFSKNMIEERKRFSWEEMCGKLLEVYNSLK